MSIAGSHRSSCRDYKPCSRQSPGSARRGRYVNPASSTASVQCRKAQTDVPVRDKLRSQPGREDHQAYRQGVCNLKRKTGPTPHYVYRWKPQELAVKTTSRQRQSPGSARRGREVNPEGTASVQSRKAQTYVPVRDKVRSQPGREDHQAYRNSKGS